MVIDDVAVSRLPDVPLQAGYVMRAYRAGDAPSWADTLQKGGFTEWTEDRVLEYLEDRRTARGLSHRRLQRSNRSRHIRIANPTLPLAQRRGRVRSTQGIPEICRRCPRLRGDSPRSPRQWSRKSDVHVGRQVPSRPRLSINSLAEDRRLEVAGDPHLSLNGVQTRHSRDHHVIPADATVIPADAGNQRKPKRHARPLGNRLPNAEGGRI